MPTTSVEMIMISLLADGELDALDRQRQALPAASARFTWTLTESVFPIGEHPRRRHRTSGFAVASMSQ
jgi:hypothetical protein